MGAPAGVGGGAVVAPAGREAGRRGGAAPVRTPIPASEIEGTAAHAAAHAEDEPTFAPSEPTHREAEPQYDADSVFAKLKPLKRGRDEDQE